MKLQYNIEDYYSFRVLFKTYQDGKSAGEIILGEYNPENVETEAASSPRPGRADAKRLISQAT